MCVTSGIGEDNAMTIMYILEHDKIVV